jgi:ABC-2 type transport system ATP-binding protein
MNVFEAQDIVKDYSGYLALDKVSIEVAEGSIFGLLGPNGAGKTTLIRIANQITAPDSGQLTFMGHPLRPDDVALIGYLPEERGLYKKMKVGEQALYLAQLKGLSRQDALKKLRYWFEKFEIRAWWDKKVEELSKGMAQKVQFITTVLHEPKLLIFDEPFSGFDPINAQLLKNEIIDLGKNGASIIFSTHNMASVEELCTDIALINKSRVILSGNVNDIRQSNRSGIFDISYEGESSSLYKTMGQGVELMREHRQFGVATVRLRCASDIDNNMLLERVLPAVRVVAFNEVVPSMNDIFIKTVGGDETETANALLTE